MGLNPQRTGCCERIDSCSAPPGRFVAVAMKLTMMSTAKGNGELVADLATKCSLLREAQMMGI